jgi:hypothetical protein
MATPISEQTLRQASQFSTCAVREEQFFPLIRLPEKKKLGRQEGRNNVFSGLFSCLPAFLIEFFLRLSANRISGQFSKRGGVL